MAQSAARSPRTAAACTITISWLAEESCFGSEESSQRSALSSRPARIRAELFARGTDESSQGPGDLNMKRPSVSGRPLDFQNRWTGSLEGWPVLGRLAADGRFHDLAGFEAGGAHADALVGAVYACAHRTQVHVPAAAAHVVSVADLVSKLRAFAADVANLCHSIDSRYLKQKGFISFRSCG